MNVAIAMIEDLCRRYPRAEWGPAHIVLSDYNLEDHWLDMSIAHVRAAPPSDENNAVLACLLALRAIHEDTRCAETDAE